MERGGGALVSSNLRTAAHHASLLLPARPADPARRWRRRLLPPFRSHSCFKEKDDLIMHKRLWKSDFKVFSTYGSQEASLSSEGVNKDKLLIDCGDDRECALGGIVALGKFDALHIGHQQLAIHASKAGTLFLLSFIRMAEVLGWESRPVILRLSAWGARELFHANYTDCMQKHKASNSFPLEFGLVKRFWRFLLEKEGLDGDMLWSSIPKKQSDFHSTSVEAIFV